MGQRKQTFEDIIYGGEEPTDEYLEEFNAINNSVIDDEDVERQALQFKPEEPITSLQKDPSYKTSESSFSSWLIIGSLIALVFIYFYRAKA